MVLTVAWHEITRGQRHIKRGRIQPIKPFAPHAVETIGELEMIDYLVQMSEGDSSIVVVATIDADHLRDGPELANQVFVTGIHCKQVTCGRCRLR